VGSEAFRGEIGGTTNHGASNGQEMIKVLYLNMKVASRVLQSSKPYSFDEAVKSVLIHVSTHVNVQEGPVYESRAS